MATATVDRLKSRRAKFPIATPSSVAEFISILIEHYPNAHCELNFSNPFELLIATILSAQCTDVRVNIVTKVLFNKFPNPQALASAKLSEVEEVIHSTGFYKNKAKNIIECSKSLVQSYVGIVPQTLDELVHLAGVGRKTANVVLGNAFEITSGVVVDTHVSRLAHRFGWSKNKNPEKIAEDLEKIIPRDEWIRISHLLIWHGRRVCKARNPDCESCFLFDRCPQLGL